MICLIIYLKKIVLNISLINRIFELWYINLLSSLSKSVILKRLFNVTKSIYFLLSQIGSTRPCSEFVGKSLIQRIVYFL